MKTVLPLVLLAAIAVPAAPALAATGATSSAVTRPEPAPAAALVDPFVGARPASTPTSAAPTTAPGFGTRPGGPTSTEPTAPAAATTPATPATSAAPATGPAPTAGTVALVARYNFDGGATGGHIADTSGRGPVLSVRSVDQGTIRFSGATGGGQYISFPDVCAEGARTCPRGLLEAPNDVDLNPGTRLFRWSANVHLTKAQIKGSSNVMQKGVANTGSQWKMQIGATQGRAQCVAVGAGSPTVYVARSTNSVADGAWHKVLCQRSGTVLAVYVDGTLRGQTTVPATMSITNELPMRIGGANFNNSGAMYHGLLDDVYAELG
ncbi:LamG-like jellyroll fold domain-containing protein [Micromonosporaceae bacterium Da 78-11]